MQQLLDSHMAHCDKDVVSFPIIRLQHNGVFGRRQVTRVMLPGVQISPLPIKISCPEYLQWDNSAFLHCGNRDVVCREYSGISLYKPLKCGNLCNKDTILCPSVVL